MEDDSGMHEHPMKAPPQRLDAAGALIECARMEVAPGSKRKDEGSTRCWKSEPLSPRISADVNVL